MHVYGWPIVAKVAAHDWNSHRNSSSAQNESEFHRFGSHKGMWRIGSDRARTNFRQNANEGRSYAETVKVVKPHMAKVESNLVMSWLGSSEVEDWLSRSAMGVLKYFGSVDPVNKKLEDRGFLFSTSFMGGKSIVWTFESSYERDGFVKNSFFSGESVSSPWKNVVSNQESRR